MRPPSVRGPLSSSANSVQDDRDEQVHEEVLAEQDDWMKKMRAPARARRDGLHRVDPFAGEQDEHGEHGRAAVVEVVARLLLQAVGAPTLARGTRSVRVARARRPDAAEELHAEQREHEHGEADEEDEVGHLRDGRTKVETIL